MEKDRGEIGLKTQKRIRQRFAFLNILSQCAENIAKQGIGLVTNDEAQAVHQFYPGIQQPIQLG